MTVTVNGKKIEAPDKISVTRLLAEAKVEMPEYVSVQVNDEMLLRENFDSTILQEGDLIEFLYYMGGGRG
jgi:sulfur carrier protein